MLELAEALLERLDRGESVAVATVTRINGSAPRTLGTAMAVDARGSVIGSISGGCVEGAVYEACQEVLESGVAVTHEFGYSDDDAFAVGLACGGRIEVIVQRLGPAGDGGVTGVTVGVTSGAGGAEAAALHAELEAAAAGQTAGVVLVTGGRALGTVLAGGSELAAVPGLSADSARRLLAELAARIGAGRPGLAVVDCEDGPIEALFVVASVKPRMIVFGAVDFSAALANAAVLLGYRVTICDARPVFATAERFPAADEVIVEWPADYLARTDTDSRTAVVVLTHDDKFDIPLLQVALGLPLAYVGAMGSRRTHDRRLDALTELVPRDSLARLHSPIGLDIGASTPEETAVSILAEIVAVRNAGSGSHLRTLSGPIHRSAPTHAATGISRSKDVRV
ncbi:XshC-Cox1-family protein [Subtercola boreus]|uniref:XshC-Cox1-family protein n=1 Tax=Subtercola boreus TaxID=120213 RepID=A0A3E0VGM3_9MICO|nr:XdhC/CoxI family protein [Subtercola boreus]RFA08693.1 XshC-Cox1-family protein [Subtercola boreus]TQL54357.1 xanthine dehydrogenase accessory factor [Subtercola boreus]